MADPRARILDAALACFLEHGYERTTIADIRARSGVSNGALFHRFPTKDAIADALYVEAIASFQDGLWQLLARRPRSLRAAVRGTIAQQIEWIEANVERARFVYTRGTLDGDSPGSEELERLNSELGAAYEAWLQPLVRSGRVRPMSMLMLTAIVTGPTHAIARRWLAGALSGSLREHLAPLAHAACAALTGTPAAVRGPEPVREGRLRLELVGAGGRVLGRGEGRVEIETTLAPG